MFMPFGLPARAVLSNKNFRYCSPGVNSPLSIWTVFRSKAVAIGEPVTHNGVFMSGCCIGFRTNAAWSLDVSDELTTRPAITF